MLVEDGLPIPAEDIFLKPVGLLAWRQATAATAKMCLLSQSHRIRILLAEWQECTFAFALAIRPGCSTDRQERPKRKTLRGIIPE